MGLQGSHQWSTPLQMKKIVGCPFPTPDPNQIEQNIYGAVYGPDFWHL